MRKFRVTLPITASLSVSVEMSDEKEKELLDRYDVDELEDCDLEDAVLTMVEEELGGSMSMYSFRVKEGELLISGDLNWEDSMVEED